MKKAIYYTPDNTGISFAMDCIGDCESCQFKFWCYTEKSDRIEVDEETFYKQAKLWGKDWLVKAGRGLD